MDGQVKRRTDRLIIDHVTQGTELLVFYRRSKREHAGAGFRYQGTFSYESHGDPGPEGPTPFRLRRNADSE
jgi:hypothetical protein